MSEFKADVRVIDRVWEHDNADSLELASVEGLDYQFVVGKGDNFAVGDVVVYIPVDALLPEPLIALMGLTGRLSGPKNNRVKTIKLRGAISQGLVVRTFALLDAGLLTPLDGGFSGDVTEALGITKYSIFTVDRGDSAGSLPDMVEVYDIESCQRHKATVEMLLDQSVYITEKLEGTHISVTVNDKVFICSRRQAKKDGMYVDAAQDMITQCHQIKKILNANQITLRGELIGPGIQRNIYKLDKPEVYLFDIKADGVYIDPEEFYSVLTWVPRYIPVSWAPRLSRSGLLRTWLNGRTIQEASNGYSVINSKTRREGIVIRPAVEQRVKFGRLILKQRSPEYLCREK